MVCSRLTSSDQTELRIRNSSTKSAPNGRMPPITMSTPVFMNQLCSGICLGMFEVAVGNSMGSFL